MSHALRLLQRDDLDDAMTLISNAFGGAHHPDDDAAEIALWEPERFYGAYDGSRLVGTCGSFAFEMTVPGGPAPVAGVTWVGVAPTDHRKGIARSLMRRQLDDLHAAGEPVAALWASEGGIYQRFGYSPAAWTASVDVPSKSAFIRPVEIGGLSLVSPDAAALSPAYDHARARRSGWFARNDAFWAYRLHDPEHWRKGASELHAVVSEGRYGIDGYALYANTSKWDSSLPSGSVRVREMAASSPEVTAQLWRYLLDLDLMANVTQQLLPLDEPLLQLLANPRSAKARIADNLWVRLVDVAAGLSARSYAAPVDVVLDVTDDFCPWNTGRFRLSGGPTGATCTPTQDAAELSLTVNDLAAAYLGGTTLVSRAAAGHVDEERPGALAEASLAFGWAGPAPYCPMVF